MSSASRRAAHGHPGRGVSENRARVLPTISSVSSSTPVNFSDASIAGSIGLGALIRQGRMFWLLRL